MFKCKIDLSEFDKNEKKVADLDLNKTKALAKAAVKKLASGAGEKTSFFLVRDYFENNGKVVGDFFALGINKKLSKHFLTIELKAKAGVAMAKNAKSASMGEVYVKDVAGKNILHFEPHDKSKLPVGQWPKVLKGLKAFFGGMKAVLVLDGKTIEAEEGGEEDVEVAAKEVDTPQEAAPNLGTAVLDQIKTLLKAVSEGMKNEIMVAVVPNIKAKKVSDKDLTISTELLNKIQELEKLYASAEDSVKKALQVHVDKVVALTPKLNQIKEALNKLLSSTEAADTDDISADDQAALDKLLKEGQDFLKQFQKNMEGVKKDISKVASETIAGGKELLSKLY